ncbi:MAG: hypothetical protein LBI19_04670 [Oscillospiraceae bacterium]|nr:hypothetical protein [Oscillospiraceae bacterium]
MRKTVKIIALCLCAELAVFGIAFGISCIPRHIQREITGIEVLLGGSADAQYTGEFIPLETREVTVRIDGWLQDRWFADPRYKGVLEIDGYPYTQDGWWTEITFNARYEYGWVTHFREPVPYTTPVPPSYPLGVLFTDKKFSSLSIWLMDVLEEQGYGKYSGKTGNCVIAAPASDWPIARDILYQNRFFWIDHTGVYRYNS